MLRCAHLLLQQGTKQRHGQLSASRRASHRATSTIGPTGQPHLCAPHQPAVVIVAVDDDVHLMAHKGLSKGLANLLLQGDQLVTPPLPAAGASAAAAEITAPERAQCCRGLAALHAVSYVVTETCTQGWSQAAAPWQPLSCMQITTCSTQPMQPLPPRNLHPAVSTSHLILSGTCSGNSAAGVPSSSLKAKQPMRSNLQQQGTQRRAWRQTLP
jgi:hypothetical protein